ncbi:hypothetical protein AB6A40_010225 [Gnathostoma spinigerum]|uniref:Uncharacterized protein n=1 Tax=Gnathostoma spinigerum TaxID=75299 RepID=A0ABD6F0Q7_9BILA
MDQENAYVILHMLLIFWVPATIVIVCYLIVSCWVYLNSRPSVLGSSPISNDSLKNSVKCHIDGGGTSFISKSSDWKPLKSILKNRTELKSIGGPSTGPPRLTINDKKTGCSSTNYSAEYDVCSRLGKRYEHNVYMGNSQSYNTKLTRYVPFPIQYSVADTFCSILQLMWRVLHS